MRLIDEYFIYVQGEYELKQADEKAKTPGARVWLREPQSVTFSGLALFLGFSSIDDFCLCGQKKHYRHAFNYARLRVIAAYEQLLFEKPTGAIFALKSMGWGERPGVASEAAKTLKVEITGNGLLPAESEKDVLRQIAI